MEMDFCEELYSPNNAFSLFNHIFLLNESTSSVDEAAMVLLYNFALALQIRGLLYCKSLFLRKSLRVYHLLNTMLESRSYMLQGRGWQLLMLAVWTNMGHIHSHCARKVHAKECGDRVRELLQLSPDVPIEDELFFHQILFHMDAFSFEHLAAAA